MVSDIDYTKMAIVNGEDVAENSLIAKSTVAIGHYFVGFNEFEPFCSGVIVSKDTIITAAHCLKDFSSESSFRILFGKNSKEVSSEFFRDIDQVVLNPNYAEIYSEDGQFLTSMGDIAAIKIVGEIPQSSAPVSIINENLKLGDFFELVVAGWGHMLNQGAEYMQFSKHVINKYWASHIVIREASSKGACNGDSGGPVYILDNQRLVVVGLVRGPHFPATECGTSIEFTNLSAHTGLIVELIDKAVGFAPAFVGVQGAEMYSFDLTPPSEGDLNP